MIDTSALLCLNTIGRTKIMLFFISDVLGDIDDWK